MKINTEQFTITHNMLLESDFKTIKVDYKFLLFKEIYEAEYYAIKKLISDYSMSESNIIQVNYISGLITPYINDNTIKSINNSYDVIVTFKTENAKRIGTSTNNDAIVKDKLLIQNLFDCTSSLDMKKSVYIKLIKKYHPDVSDYSSEIAQFINSFKTW